MALLFSAGAAVNAACSTGSAVQSEDSVASGGSAQPGASGGDSSTGGLAEDDDGLFVPNAGGQGGNGDLTVCEEVSVETDLAPVYLAFAFDVSGSMGELDEPRWWHDPARKWEPVVAATAAFFEDTSLARVNASMVLFPADDDECDAETYATPDVPMTTLPSSAFGETLAEYEAEVGTPLAGGDWRGGTPTFAVLRGAASSLDALRERDPAGAFAAVLVTDGLPQSCDEGLEETVEAARELAEQGLRTYVIGIENPTTPPAEPPSEWDDWGDCDDGGGDEPCPAPDTLDALNRIADAGNTTSAFLIDTGDPTATKKAFLAAIESIRKGSVSCSVPIPPHPDGRTFSPDEIDVSLTSGGSTERLAFDESCSRSASWRYQEGETELSLELCLETCDRILSSPGAKLKVEFLCGPRPAH